MAFLKPDMGRVFVVAGVDENLEKKQVQLSGNLKRFWTDRGFRLFTKQSKNPPGIYLWIAEQGVTRRSSLKATAAQQVA